MRPSEIGDRCAGALVLGLLLVASAPPLEAQEPEWSGSPGLRAAAEAPDPAANVPDRRPAQRHIDLDPRIQEAVQRGMREALQAPAPEPTPDADAAIVSIEPAPNPPKPTEAAQDWESEEELRAAILRAAAKKQAALPVPEDAPDLHADAAEPTAEVEPPTDAGPRRSVDPLAEWRRRSPLDDRQERAARIDVFEPPELGVSNESLLPPRLVRIGELQWARFLDALAFYDSAAEAYEAAIGLGAGGPDTWRGLGRARIYTGNLHAAEAALLSALDATEAAPVALESNAHAQLLRELGELYLLMQDLPEARRALERSQEMDGEDARARMLLAQARYAMGVGNADDVPTPLAPWPPSRGARIRSQIERSLTKTSAALPPSLRTQLRELGRPFTRTENRRIGLLAMVGLLAAALVLRLMRGRGDLVVAIDYPQELLGELTVEIHTQPGQVKRAVRGEAEKKTSTPTEHYMVSRETQFRGLRPGRYYVVVHGVLKDGESEQVLSEPFEEQRVEVRSKASERLDFDVGPAVCPVDVVLLWDKRPASEAGVCVRGLPQSLRYTKGGDVRLNLRMGTHVIVVGSGDRVAEQEVQVESFAATEVVFELSDASSVIFKGCPPAVQPYLQGDLGTSARALERDGQDTLAHRMLARLHEEQGHPRRAAEQYEVAGEFERAAVLRQSLSQFAHAADLFNKVGQHARAAQMYRKCGDWCSAGESYDAAGDVEKAIHAFRKAGESSRWIDILERHGRYYEASEVALAADDRPRALQLLQEVGRTDAIYADACLKLADIYEKDNRPELAIERLQSHIAHQDEPAPELLIRLAALFEQAGEYDTAMVTLENVQNTNPNFPSVSTRIDNLRKKISQREIEESAGNNTGKVQNSDVATAFLHEQRYEILEELGRGGMGVVLKARDKRLNRIVALKRLPENLREHPRAIELFLREAQAAARLNHRNIVTVYDTDHDNGQYFITMELLEGRPLNAILREAGQVAAIDVARVGMQVAAGLQYAHDQRVIHRDIKTANLFLTLDKTVKIMDFGLAKMIEQVRRESTIIGGTPYYMAPEQAVGEAVDHRTDIYALGITFYELLTGAVPFRDGDVTYQHRHTAPNDPREVVASIPAEMAELVLHMIAKDPDARCNSATEVAQRLESLARGGAV